MKDFIPAVSLFSGAGGLDFGARRSGFRTMVAIDSDPIACSTLKSNKLVPGDILAQDICSVDPLDLLRRLKMKRGSLPLLFGGPPCQSFSKAAYWTSRGDEADRRRQRDGIRHKTKRVAGARQRNPRGDARTLLLGEFLRILHGLMPKQFLLENVASLSHPSNRQFLESFLRDASAIGYHVEWFRLNAMDFGVPQRRDRLFIVGSSEGSPAGRPRLPTRTGELSVRDFIGPYKSKKYFEPEEAVTGRWATALSEVPPGMNYKALTAWAHHPSPRFIAEQRFWNFLLKLHPQRPSWTLAANPGPWVGPFHWTNRRLRIPEMAAIQTFPDGYVFEGSRRDKVRQIGNAVPPELAKVVMRGLARNA